MLILLFLFSILFISLITTERQLEQEDPDFWNLSRWNPVRELQVQTETWPQISGLIRKFANESIFHYNLVKMEPLITSERVASSSVDEL
jgi:hypothetical protein